MCEVEIYDEAAGHGDGVAERVASREILKVYVEREAQTQPSHADVKPHGLRDVCGNLPHGKVLHRRKVEQEREGQEEQYRHRQHYSSPFQNASHRLVLGMKSAAKIGILRVKHKLWNVK